MCEHLLLIYSGNMFGASETTCIVIGNSIGANKVSLARRYFKVILLYNFVWNSAIAILFILEGKAIAVLFTNDLEI